MRGPNPYQILCRDVRGGRG
uniref:Uncharacterized protein n=1 Tax=Arundo donax TaxID=35708 RepID=A0A0A8Z2R7_ARUDO